MINVISVNDAKEVGYDRNPLGKLELGPFHETGVMYFFTAENEINYDYYQN